MEGALPKPIFEEQHIVDVVVAGTAAEIINAATDGRDVVVALDPDNFPDNQKQKMNNVRKLAQDLDIRELELMLEALKHAIASTAHQGQVSFALQETDYEIDGTGLEIKDEAIEVEGGEPTPIAIVFIKQKP
jgi:hypothetical protein